MAAHSMAITTVDERKVQKHMLIYSSIVERMTRRSFQAVQDHNYGDVLKGVASRNLTHRFAGPNSLGGSRHDKDALARWFKRLGTVLPTLRLDVKDVLVHGGPRNTTVIVRWVATTTLATGEPYVNPGVHVIKLRWGKAYDFDVYEDTYVVTDALAKQAASGITEAIAPQIVS
jgi:ketosteroid isomerase-like protein